MITKTFDEDVKFHPIANIFPLMEGDDFDSLVADIKAYGLLESIWIYDGMILDGRNRFLACAKAGVKPKFRDYRGDNPLGFVLSLNLERRHLDQSQRACLAAEVLPLYEQEAKKRQKMGVEKIPHPEQKGKARDFVARSFNVNAHYVQDAKLIKTESPSLFEEVKSGVRHIKEALNHIKKDKKEKAHAELVERSGKMEAKRYGEFIVNDIYLADINSIQLPENSIDMIFTDPPYHDEYLDLFSALAVLAERSLKPGAYLMTYCGKMFLPEIMNRLGARLEYVWEFGVYQPDNNTKIAKHNLFEAWRPILCYKKPGKTITREWQPDMIKGTRDKSFHEWQQQIEPPLKYIEAYTQPGDLVVDPFVGGGTTPTACQLLKRNYLCFDKDEQAVKIAKLRLSETRI